MSEKKRVLCYGDSLTWGWVPVESTAPTTRYPWERRWTGAMAAALGGQAEIVEEGLSGRTTNADDPTDPRLNGAAHLPAALATHLPLDLVVIMLGTNDTKVYFGRTPFEIAAGASTLVAQVAGCAGGVGTVYPAPPVLLVSPPPLGEIPDPWFAELFQGGREKTRELPRHYRALASFLGVSFADAGRHVATEGVDGIHFTAENNLALGTALAQEVAALL
ncbi:SGNH/GDSL hydrolase family protein [Streptomyces sp. DSM 44917]|uniref:SGNH/GDSL hydrolase family protein n=1 Tax=Streptomyces boetiae TaxID=3075541 RepID=A0ABU2L7J2_9ACTN|nr:SGNH/GDSL hydrolase family protein [Streptomyces sp. DSM 44917]MDT0307421.1 SGNH/GDSL hydrolase family protein [Streptomyces sp. DSM 44917]